MCTYIYFDVIYTKFYAFDMNNHFFLHSINLCDPKLRVCLNQLLSEEEYVRKFLRKNNVRQEKEKKRRIKIKKQTHSFPTIFGQFKLFFQPIQLIFAQRAIPSDSIWYILFFQFFKLGCCCFVSCFECLIFLFF